MLQFPTSAATLRSLRRYIKPGNECGAPEYGSHDGRGLTRVVNNVRTVSDRIGILMDTKGPEVRTTTTVNKEPIPFKTGES